MPRQNRTPGDSHTWYESQRDIREMTQGGGIPQAKAKPAPAATSPKAPMKPPPMSPAARRQMAEMEARQTQARKQAATPAKKPSTEGVLETPPPVKSGKPKGTPKMTNRY